MGYKRIKKCPICHNDVDGLWKHFWNEHKNLGLSDHEFLAKYLNLNELPRCKICGNITGIDYTNYEFFIQCSRSCGAKAAYKIKKSNGTSRTWKDTYHTKFRENNPDEYHKHHVNSGKARGKALAERIKSDPEYKEIKHKNGIRLAEHYHNEFRLNNPELYHEHRVNSGKLAGMIHANRCKTDPEYAKKNAEKLFGNQPMWHSPIEDNFINWMQELNYNLVKDVQILKGSLWTQLDALVTFNYTKIVFECDGFKFHDLDYDVYRDKTLNELYGYKFLRLDSNFCHELLDSKDNITLFKLFENVESNKPYFECLSKDEILDWKLGKLKLMD